jgi:hypothetical protein
MTRQEHIGPPEDVGALSSVDLGEEHDVGYRADNLTHHLAPNAPHLECHNECLTFHMLLTVCSRQSETA